MTEKNILLVLSSHTAKLTEEALLACFAMASFEHRIFIAITHEALPLLASPETKLFKMLTSLDLYDVQNLWVISPNSDNDVKAMTLGIAEFIPVKTVTSIEELSETLTKENENLTIDLLWQV